MSTATTPRSGESAPRSTLRPALRPRSRPLALRAAVAAVALTGLSGSAFGAFDVVEKNIADLEAAYSTGATSAVGVTQQYLDRIAQYNGTSLTGINAIAQLNPDVLAEAARVDSLIAGGATTAQYPLLGVPMIIKNSYDVAGLTTTNGVSILNGANVPGATTLTAPTNAFSVQRLKDAGAIIIGKAALSTMAYSYNGIDNANGVVLNPYSPTRSPGGSSSGSGAGLASNFAMLAMGGETGGSIRVPSNHNALVGLKTSVGLIDPGGTFPLSPYRDVVGPMGKTVTDIAYGMNALVAPSPTNLWNGTPPYPRALPGSQRPANYLDSLSDTALEGKVIAVPKYMANRGDVAYEGNVHPLVLDAFNRALDTIRAQGATVIYVDEPAAQNYYNTIGRPNSRGGATTAGFGFDFPTVPNADGTASTTPSFDWNSTSAAYYYNAVIEGENNPTIKNISDFALALRNGADANAGNPLSPLGTKRSNGTYTGAAGAITSLATLYEAGLAAGFGDANSDGMPDNPDAIKALQAFADLRRSQYENFMATPNLVDDLTTPDVDESKITHIDAFTAPTYAGVDPLQTLILPDGVKDPYDVPDPNDPTKTLNFGSLLGRLEGNILGAPSISVPMGYLPDGTPMGIQFFDELLGEEKLLGLAYDFEQATLYRTAPDLSFIARGNFLPEPGAASILVIAGFGAAGRRRRRTA